MDERAGKENHLGDPKEEARRGETGGCDGKIGKIGPDGGGWIGRRAQAKEEDSGERCGRAALTRRLLASH